MYTKVELKQIYKKSNKTLSSLNRCLNCCNCVIYTEQNEQELNDVKAFIEAKIDIVADIIGLIASCKTKK